MHGDNVVFQLYSNPWKQRTLARLLQFSSVAQLCLTLCDPMYCSMLGLPVHHQLLEFTQTHVQWVGDAIQPSHPLSSPSLLTFNLSQHQDLFKWFSSLHQVAKVLEFQLQHQSFQQASKKPEHKNKRSNSLTNSIKIFHNYYNKKRKN